MPQMNRTTHAVGMLHLGTATLREKAIISCQRILLGDQNTSSAQCRGNLNGQPTLRKEAMLMQEALSAARNAVHSIFGASGASARLAAAREGRGPHRPHSAEQQGAAGSLS